MSFEESAAYQTARQMIYEFGLDETAARVLARAMYEAGKASAMAVLVRLP